MKSLTRPVTILSALAGTLLLAGCGGPNLVERIGGFWGYGICSIIIVVLDVIALMEVAGTDWSFGRKALWAMLIIFFPVGGLLLYWFVGKDGRK